MSLKKFYIDRDRWLRRISKNHPRPYSALYDSERDKLCCLGFWANQIHGIPLEEMDGKAIPSQVGIEELSREKIPCTQKSCDYSHHTLAGEIMDVNDNGPVHSYWERTLQEQRLKELFARAGYEPVFIN